jgi:hypothetical protein
LERLLAARRRDLIEFDYGLATRGRYVRAEFVTPSALTSMFAEIDEEMPLEASQGHGDLQGTR